MPLKWLRPSQIAKDPRLFVESYSRFDIKQGELADCWLLAALANLTLHNSLFCQVVPEDQSFKKDYAGIFHFRFWQFGKWVEVVIDDRLPTFNGELVFLRSTQQNEFWSALLEKAYAKLHGSYEALKGGSTCEAMEDFTGGVTELHDLDKVDMQFFKTLKDSFERQSLMGASIEPDSPDQFECRTPDGLIMGHAYSVTKVQYVDIKTPRVSGKIPLIRLRNPWGNEVEWKGAWSDESQEWQFIPQEEKNRIGLTFDKDGEFWMSFRDFVRKFSRLEICLLGPGSWNSDNQGKKCWEASVFEGEWVRGTTAGGCRNYPKTFSYNPQYRVTLEPSFNGAADCEVIVALMQKNRRAQRKMGAQSLNIGFVLYQLNETTSKIKPLPSHFFLENVSTYRCKAFINLREVTERFRLTPGTYCVVPSTYEPQEEGEFLLRIFSETKILLEENDKKIELVHAIKKVNVSPVEAELDKRVQEFFKAVAGDDLEVDWMELKNVLDFSINKDLQRCSIGPANLIQRGGFSKEICRSMVAMMDTDRSGKLGYEEFKTLWLDVCNWRRVFKEFDKGRSGMLSDFELRDALASAGYQLNCRILNVLMHRYGTKEGQITFDDFIACAVRLKCMIDMFKERDPRSTNKAIFTFDEWMEKIIFS
ncbi:Hypothetical predicted protein [Cloeon dipterum]|nr:Hypothetical predicted protein [Cloeon dipterum]